MLGHRDLTMQDYIKILKRRLWIILITAFIFLGVGIGVTFVIPPQFVSQTPALRCSLGAPIVPHPYDCNGWRNYGLGLYNQGGALFLPYVRL